MPALLQLCLVLVGFCPCSLTAVLTPFYSSSRSRI